MEGRTQSAILDNQSQERVGMCVESWTAKLTEKGYVRGQMLFDGTEESYDGSIYHREDRIAGNQ